MTSETNEPKPGIIRNPRDFFGGLAMVGCALFAFWASSNLPGMRGFQFGAGTGPRLLAGILLALGAVIIAMSLVRDGPARPALGWRGLLIVTGALLLFAVSVRPMGLLPSTFALFLVAATASDETRWGETILAAFAMVILIYLVFIVALGVPFDPWPRFLTR